MRIPHSQLRKPTFQVAPPRSLGWFGLDREEMGLWCKIVFTTTKVLFFTKWCSSGCRWVKYSSILQAEINDCTYMLRLYTSSCKMNTEPALILHSKSVTIFNRPLTVFRVYRLQHWQHKTRFKSGKTYEILQAHCGHSCWSNWITSGILLLPGHSVDACDFGLKERLDCIEDVW